jgi:hypothetical protein
MSKSDRWLPSMLVPAMCFVWATGVTAQSVAGDGGAPQSQKLVEQKLRLVELLVASPAAKGGEHLGSQEALAVLDRRRQLLDQARRAMVRGEFDEAGRMLDEVLIRSSRPLAQPSAGGAGLNMIAQQTKLKNLSEQLASYRGTLQSLARAGRPNGDAQTLLTRTDALGKEAEALAAAGHLETANQRLSEAYRLVVQGLASLQAGQTMTLSLQFDTPEQEYAYEQRRFQSNEMLLRMTIDEGRPTAEQLRLVEGLAAEGRRLRDEAIESARAGDHRAAIVAMEKASTRLIRGLQAMGVPIF